MTNEINEQQKIEDQPLPEGFKDPQAIFNFEEKRELFGKLVAREQGKHGVDFLVELEDGGRSKVFGTKVLRNKLAEVQPGQKIYIRYLGKKTSEKSGEEYHDFKVGVGEE